VVSVASAYIGTRNAAVTNVSSCGERGSRRNGPLVLDSYTSPRFLYLS
jgi:hypothetical protein